MQKRVDCSYDIDITFSWTFAQNIWTAPKVCLKIGRVGNRSFVEAKMDIKFTLYLKAFILSVLIFHIFIAVKKYLIKEEQKTIWYRNIKFYCYKWWTKQVQNNFQTSSIGVGIDDDILAR